MKTDIEEFRCKRSSQVEDKKVTGPTNNCKTKRNDRNATVKTRKSKTKSKRRKPIGRQEGFEIIEPDFTNQSREAHQKVEMSIAIDESFESDSFQNLNNNELSDSSDEVTMTKEKTSIDVDRQLNAKKSSFDEVISENCDIAALERELMENLRLFDEDIDLKSPMMNKIIDFPITSAVCKWMQSLSNESVKLWNIEKFSSLRLEFQYDNEDNISEISDFQAKSETDSDYSSDFQTKNNSPTNFFKGHTCSKLGVMPKHFNSESFCALM